MSTEQLISAIEAVGGRIWLQGGSVHYKLPKEASARFLPALRAHREQVCQVLMETELKGIPVETACRCSKWSFPHVHGREDRRRAIEQWNRESVHKVEWIQ